MLTKCECVAKYYEGAPLVLFIVQFHDFLSCQVYRDQLLIVFHRSSFLSDY